MAVSTDHVANDMASLTVNNTESDSVIAAYAQLEELEKVGRRSLDYVKYCECLERIEKIIFNS